MAGDDRVNIQVTLDTSAVAPGAANVVRMLDGVSSRAVADAQMVKDGWTKVSPVFDQLNERLQQLGKRYADTGIIGQRSIAALGVQIRDLQNEYGKTASKADQLSKAEQMIFQSAQTTYTDAIKKQREYNDELEKVGRATHNFTSLEGALMSLGGTVGRLTAITAGVFAAFETGWQTGRKIDAWLTANVEGWQRWKDEVSENIVEAEHNFEHFLATLHLTTPPKVNFKDLLVPIGAKGEETQLKLNLEMGLEAQGIKTLAKTQEDIAKFRDQVGLLKVEAANFPEHTGLDKFLQDSGTKLKEWAAAFQAAGKPLPADLKESLNKVFGPDAAATFAKSASEAIKAKQTIENQFTDLQKFTEGLKLKFQPPETDPIRLALREVQQIAQAAFDDISAREQKARQDIESQKAKAVEFAAEINKIKQAGDQGPDIDAQIGALQRRRAEALQQVQVDEKILATLKGERGEVEHMRDSLQTIRTDNALAEAAKKAREEFEKVDQAIEDIAAKAKQTVESLKLPGGLEESINAQIDQAKAEAKQQHTIIASLFFDPEIRAEVQKAADAMRDAHIKGLTDGAKVLGDRLHKAAQELADAIDKFASDMADVFTAGVTGGAEGFAKAASKLFLQGVNDGAKAIFKNLALIAFGGTPDKRQFDLTTEEGRDKFATATEESAKQQQAIIGAISGAVGAIGETLSIFKNAKQGQEVSVLGTTLSFAAAGASLGSAVPAIGTAIGAVVGALAGLTIALIANAKAIKSLPYAAYGIRDGVPYVEPYKGKEKNFANVTDSMFNDMISQMWHTLENTRNDYIKLLMKFPDGVADAITSANFAPTMKKYQEGAVNWWKMILGAVSGMPYVGAAIYGGRVPRKIEAVPGSGQLGDPNFDKNALKTFPADFQNWVNNTLPKEIIATFEAPMAKGFETLGLTAEKFHTIWDRLQAIDPKDAIKSLNDLFDALTAFKKVRESLSQDIYGGKGFVFSGGLIEQARAEIVQSFADKLAQADVAMVSMGQTIEAMIGPEQITQAKAWGDALLQRNQAVQEFLKQIVADIDSTIAGYQSKIRDLTLAGFKTETGAPDIAAQVGYLKKYADTLWGQITQATTPEQVMQLSNELSNTISKIQQIGGAQSVEAAEAYRVWAIQQLQKAQDLVVAQLNKMAMDVAQQNQNFLDAIQGFIDAFLGATERLTGDANQDQPPQTEIPPPPERHNEGPHRWIIKGQEDLFSQTGESLYTPPQPNQAQGLYEPPDANQSRELMTMVVAGSQENVVYLKRIAVNQEQILAVLAEGRDLRVSADDMTIHIEDQAVSVPMSVDDGGFDRRTINSRGKRAT